MMNEHPYFHWDLLRQPLQTPQFGMAPSFFDVNSILELRKEKSRDAARSRRGKENYEFYELAKMLPLPAAITSQLDKASIIRLTISYLKLRNFSTQGDPQWTPSDNAVGSMGTGCKNGKVLPGHRRMDMLDPFESQQGTHILQSLDGFAFILANDGRFLYISETVSIYLGLSQVEMAGSSIFDYVHHDDHGELTDHLGMCSVPVHGQANTPPSSGSEEAASPGQRSQTPSETGYAMVHQWDKNIHKSFCLRMKSTLTKRGAHVKTSGYRVLHILGTLRPQSVFGLAQGNSQSGSSAGDCASNNVDTTPPMGLVGMAFALPPPTVSELRLEMDTFILRLSPGFRVTYCDPPLSDLMDLSPDDVNERMLYDLCHAADLKLLQQAHNDIITKGQALTDYWRLLNRHGGYTWVQTFATTLFNNKTPEDQTILAINYVISGVRSPGCCEDLWQVTGDVTSSMSSTYRCPVRDQLLKGLQKKDASKDEKPSSSSNTKASDKPSQTQRANDKDKTEIDENKSISSSGKDSKRQKQTLPTISSSSSSSKIEDEISKDSNGGNILDGKNSRRKMENPRKRKKSEEESENSTVPRKAVNASKPDSMTKTLSRSSHVDVPPISQCAIVPPASFPSLTNTIYTRDAATISSSPEDLSVKKTSQTHRVTDGFQQQFTPTNISVNNVKTTSGQNDPNAAARIQPTHTQVGNSSVNELEAAMNRHLQTQALDCKMNPEGVTGYDGKPESTVSSTGSKLLSVPPLIAHGGQWVPSSPRTPPTTSGDILPTSDLLRCLYTTRESVIKTNARSQNQIPKTSSYLNGETPSSLLTPPEPESSSNTSAVKSHQTPQRPQHHLHTKRGNTDSNQHNNALQYFDSNLNLHQSLKGSNEFGERDSLYKDSSSIKDQFQFLPYKDSLSYIDHFAAGYKDHMTSTYKDFPQFKDIVPAFTIPNLVSPGGRFQHNYPSLSHHFTLPMTSSVPNQGLAPTDPCSMTPPASNSPDIAATKSSQSLGHHQNHHQNLIHHQQQHQHQHSQPVGTSNDHPLPTHPPHHAFNDNISTTYPTDIIHNNNNANNNNNYNNNNQLSTTSKQHQLTPNEISSHSHLPNNPNATSAAPSPNSTSSYHQYRHHYGQDYGTPAFHPNQDLTKTGGYYGMAPTPVASMYMELNNSAHYDSCHRPTLTWY